MATVRRQTALCRKLRNLSRLCTTAAVGITVRVGLRRRRRMRRPRQRHPTDIILRIRTLLLKQI